LITAAIAALLAAIVAANLWPTAYPLFAASALVASVTGYFIPKIKSALLDYQKCRGPSDKCQLSLGINNLGYAASTLSAVSFLLAGLMQVTALAFIASFFLSWLAVPIVAAVYYLVKTGTYSCAVTILILIGVTTNAWAFKHCMDGGRPYDPDGPANPIP
jgi:hypothetical protein